MRKEDKERLIELYKKRDLVLSERTGVRMTLNTFQREKVIKYLEAATDEKNKKTREKRAKEAVESLEGGIIYFNDIDFSELRMIDNEIKDIILKEIEEN